ncbi:jg25377 [Pararge aegeria aegeria]|uniref:Jg25377 protein n=1 Tax=Pararge aegeria aegeria TaxID=348720 RepID=A0A8S4S293_9NEOP|nr:jg25377 [Pararge aegeria aegeria]
MEFTNLHWASVVDYGLNSFGDEASSMIFVHPKSAKCAQRSFHFKNMYNKVHFHLISFNKSISSLKCNAGGCLLHVGEWRSLSVQGARTVCLVGKGSGACSALAASAVPRPARPL